MLSRSLKLAVPVAVLACAGVFVACAASSKNDNVFGGSSGDGVSGSSSSGSGVAGSSSGGGVGGNSGSGSGVLSGALSSSGSSSGMDGAARPARCDASGQNCSCFNVASLGYGGHTGSQLGMGGTDNTQAFVAYMNKQSSALFAQFGCGTDIGCTNPNKPNFADGSFLPNYDVLIFQWMAGALMPVTNSGGMTEGYQGSNYWTFSQDELDALKAWVMAGGGVIILSGYDYVSGELGPTNQVLSALTDLSYTATDTYGLTETGNAEYCLGDSNPVTGWAPAPDKLGANITAVGAFHGRTIQVPSGSKAVVDCQDNTYGVCAVHEDVGMGHVYVYTDEWVTYTSQWNPPTQPATYCSLDGSTANGDFPAVEAAYQVPQFWANAISYAAQATMCMFTITGTLPPPR